MRKINTGDVFKLARLVNETKMTDTLKEAYLSGKKENADAEEIGVSAAMGILASCGSQRTEEMFYVLLAGICEKEPKDIKTQPIEETVKDIKQLVKENDIMNFFTQASRLAKTIKK